MSTLAERLRPHGKSPSDLATLEAWLNLGCELPPSVDFTDPDHLTALAIALDRLLSWTPLLCLLAGDDVDALVDDLAEERDAYEKESADAQRLQEAAEEREGKAEEREVALISERDELVRANHALHATCASLEEQIAGLRALLIEGIEHARASERSGDFLDRAIKETTL